MPNWDHVRAEAEWRIDNIHHEPWHLDPDYYAASRVKAKRRKSISLGSRALRGSQRDEGVHQPQEFSMKVVEGDFNTAVAEAVAKVLAGMNGTKRVRKAKGKGRVKPTPEVTAARKAANDAECIKVFTAAGFKDVQPRVNVMTYGKVKPDGTTTGWLGQGRKVKKGEKSHEVGPFRLFHIDQTEAIVTQ